MPDPADARAAAPTWADLLDPQSAAARVQATDFGAESATDFAVAPTRIATGGPGRRLHHQQAASLLVHPSGALLATCRWDERGDAEGDASNEQALYVSDDGGTAWRMENDRQPIITLDLGTSFDRPSSITHSFAWSDAQGRTWLYYTINQPFTWGAGRPDRSTGGGEIRRLELFEDEGRWHAADTSEVVWGFCRPVTDGRGGAWTDVRLLCLNGIVRLRSGRCLMPVAGRATVPEPAGAFWRLNRSWVLASDDGGATWFDLGFIGGSDALSVCEPTVVETGTDDQLVALMRVQYDTGFELYRSDSSDAGATWSHPRATGLPNTGGSGTKPYALALRGGAYALLQTNEHHVTDRTNVSLFLTDEAGMAHDRWPVVKVLASECVDHWLGSAYGWLAEAPDGALHAVWVGYAGAENHLNHARLAPPWVGGTVAEPVAPRDERGDDLPALTKVGAGRRALQFPNTRSRAHLPRVGLVATPGFRVHFSFHIDRLPSAADVHLVDLCVRNGRDLAYRVVVRPAHGSTVWVDSNLGWHDTGFACRQDGRVDVDLEVRDDRSVRLAVNGVGTGGLMFLKTVGIVSTVYVGGNVAQPEPCAFALESVWLHAGTEVST